MRMRPEWSARLSRAAQLAALDRRTVWEDTDHQPLDSRRLTAFLEALGHEVVVKSLRAASGGLEACVVPLDSQRLRFVCDPDPSPGDPRWLSEAPDSQDRRMAFRLAHEYAHTRLARAASNEWRHTDAEELSCDVYACILIGTDDRPFDKPPAEAGQEINRGSDLDLADRALALLTS
jgi:hypothetical protein